jgi:shikimate kinase
MERPLCLVGMSGVGKSHLSRMLAARGFVWHDCDAAIAAQLAELVTPAAGEAPVHALGRWMGMPWTEGYAARERRYLALEEEVTAAALHAAEAPGARHVVDTTGSVIYLSEGLRAALRARCEVVYLRTPAEDHARMLELYLREPKPVVWGGLYTAPGPEALPTAYPALLAERERRYLELAHRWLWATALRERDAGEALRLVRGA